MKAICAPDDEFRWLSGAPFQVHQPKDHRRKDELHRQTHLSARYHNIVGPTHPRVVQDGDEIPENDSLGVRKSDHYQRLIGSRDIHGDEGIAGIYRRYPLKIDMGAAELGADVVHVVGHAPQYGLDHRILAVAAYML